MKIAQIAPIIERVPPKTYGGTERVVSTLTEELVRRGHDVTLFATGDSETSARLVSVFPKSTREANITQVYKRNTWSLLNIGIGYARQQEFDIIHDHNGVLSLPTANMAQTPVVMTFHCSLHHYHKEMLSYLSNPYIVTISHAQGRGLTQLGVNNSTVYNGLSMDHYPFSAKHDGYLLFVGRICEEKGAHFAIDVAEELNLPLIIAAKVDDDDKEYFKKYVKPRLSSTIQWIGEVNEKERNMLMSKALCFLHPVTWPEPFGLTLIEAMACGCPVVAFNKGSIPEVITHGKTGFIAKDKEEMVAMVKRINEIDRIHCRYYALTTFGAETMVDGYEAIYEAVLVNTHGWYKKPSSFEEALLT